MDWTRGETWVKAEKAPQGSLTWLMGMKFGGANCVACGDKPAANWKRRHGAGGVDGEVVYEVPVCERHNAKLKRMKKWTIIWAVAFFVWATASLLILLLVDPQPKTSPWAMSEVLPAAIPAAIFLVALIIVATGEGRHTGIKVMHVDPAQPAVFVAFTDAPRSYHAWKESYPEQAEQFEQMQDPNWHPPPPPGGLPEGGWPGM
ncbi:MAG TPA: hypothetical protein VG389_27460 [Myxococcota bacterium]|jgi:hypothetical protein|nr:hypothetical protein [Myxococcota bacterium]